MSAFKPAYLLRVLLVTQLIFLVVMGLRWSGQLQGVELSAYDLMVYLGASNPSSESRIVLVWATDADQRQWRWPLSDKQLVELLERTLVYQPRVLGLDLYRDLSIPTPEGEDYSKQLNRVLTANPNIIGIMKFTDDQGRRVAPPAALEGSSQVGFNDMMLDSGIIRRGLLFLDDGERFAEYFGLKVALKYLEPLGIHLEAADPNQPELIRFGKTVLSPLDSHFGGYVDIDDAGYQFLLDFPMAYEHFPHLTITDLLTKELPPELLRDRIVIFGTNAESTPDFHYTPFSRWSEADPRVPGLAMHAYAVEQLLNMALKGDTPRNSLSEWMEYVWIWFWSLLGGVICMVCPKLWQFSVTWVGGFLLIGSITFLAFVNGWWIPAFPAMLGWGLAALLTEQLLTHAIAMENLQQKLKEAQQTAALSKTFQKFVPYEFLKHLGKDHITDLQLGDCRKQEMTILFADMRSFTKISENMTPEETFRFINTFLGHVAPAIQQHEGFIDKFIGDAIMALFHRYPDDALHAGIAMLQKLELFNEERKAAGDEPVSMGIGINTGTVILGTIGGPNRMEGTVVSDAVNLAARMENMTKEYGATLLISEHTFYGLYQPQQFACRLTDRVQVKGKAEWVTIWEVLDGNPVITRRAKVATLKPFEQALSLYFLEEFAEAQSLFEACATENPDDKAAQLYILRCQQDRERVQREEFPVKQI